MFSVSPLLQPLESEGRQQLHPAGVVVSQGDKPRQGPEILSGGGSLTRPALLQRQILCYMLEEADDIQQSSIDVILECLEAPDVNPARTRCRGPCNAPLPRPPWAATASCLLRFPFCPFSPGWLRSC